MKFNKIWIYVLAAIALAALIFVAIKYRTKTVTPATYTQNGLVRLDQSTGEVSALNPNTGQIDDIGKISSTNPISIALSPDRNKILYNLSQYSSDTVIEAGQNPDAQVVKVKSVSSNTEKTIDNAFAPAFVNNDEIAFQDITTNKIVVYSLSSDKEKKRYDFDLDSETVVQSLDDQNILLSDYISDVSDANCYVANLTTGKKTKLVGANGLQTKTFPGSDIMAYSFVSSNETVSSRALNWKTKAQVLEINQDLDSIQAAGQYIYYYDAGSIWALNTSSGEKRSLRSGYSTAPTFLATGSGIYVDTDANGEIIKL